MLPYTDFSIGDVVAGTTPVTTLREPSYHICRDTDEDSAPSGRTYKDRRFALHHLRLQYFSNKFYMVNCYQF